MLHLEDVRHTFTARGQAVHALDGACVDVAKGELVVLRGPSGSGKTTLLFTAGAMLRPNGGGTVRVAGTDVYGLDAGARAMFRATRIGFVFQTFHLVPYLDAAENVRLARTANGRPPTRGTARDVLARVGLGDRVGHRPSELSAGEQQRAAIARALVNRPAVLIADEPTGNLDPQNAEEVLALFDSFRAEGGTVLMVTHGTTADARADRVLSLVSGRVLAPAPSTP